MRENPKLHAYLAQLGIASRRKAEAMIQQGKVKINGQVAFVGQRINPVTDHIVVNGQALTSDRTSAVPTYYLIYKPVGYVSTTNDELNRPTVLKLLPQHSLRLYPVGRLDLESEGLMLLTNDGAITQKLTHPSFEIKKTYHVLVKGKPSYKALQHLEKGVKLKDGWAKPDAVKVLDHEEDSTWLEITIHSGKNRIIRRMMERVGYEVLRLIRVQIGPFNLDQLGKAKVKQLDPNEVKDLLLH